MNGIGEFIGGYWWLVFPLGGVIAGAFGGLREWDDRRRKDKIKLARIKYGQAPQEPGTAMGKVTGDDVQRVLAEHAEVQRRWLTYELDVARLIDFPMMSDMREPLTVDFHRAKRHADGLRPATKKELKDPDRFVTFRTAVHELGLAFDILEREARRRRTTTFTNPERESLQRAKQLIALAEDRGASAAERQAAYRRAMRELEGLIVVPEAATDAMEQRIAGEIDRAPVERDAAGGDGPTTDRR